MEATQIGSRPSTDSISLHSGELMDSINKERFVLKKIKLGHIGWLARDEGPDCETVAWCDISDAKLVNAKEKNPDIAMYSDYREMLKHPGLDAVVISTPNFVHAEQAIAFLDAGIHVFLEKPMGVNAAECDAILQAAVRNRKHCVIDFEMRVSFFARRIQELINSGEYGLLRGIEFIHHRGGWLEEGNGIWRTRMDKSGGLFFMEVIHAIDIMRLLAGEVTAVQCVAAPKVMQHYTFTDNVCAHLFFKSGAMATLLTSHTHSAVCRDKTLAPSLGHDMRMIFTLESGSLAVDFWEPAILVNRFEEYPAGSGGFRIVHERRENYVGIGMHAFSHDINAMRREFIKRIADNANPVQSTLDAWRSHQVCLAAEQSLREDCRRVVLDNKLPENVSEKEI